MRRLDLVVWGATGFTGRLVAAYLKQNYLARAEEPLRWGLAARSLEKLERLARDLGLEHDAVPLLSADVEDAGSLDEMARAARVVVACAGPFAQVGSPVVDACVRNGTDYCDITGEAHWVQKMIAKHHDECVRRKTLVVPLCGFDSVPSDVGCRMVVDHVRQRLRAEVCEVDGLFALGGGGASRGTLNSMVGVVSDTSALRAMRAPFALNPPDKVPEPKPHDRDRVFIGQAPAVGGWVAPFLMAGVNTRCVRRSSALVGYGPRFSYNEALHLRGAVRAFAAWLSMLLLAVLMLLPPARRLLSRFFPPPGEGPSEAARRRARSRVTMVAATADGRRVVGRLSFGEAYEFTALSVVESAVCLARRRASPLEMEGGVATPAAAMGPQLLERLRRAGVQVEVEQLP